MTEKNNVSEETGNTEEMSRKSALNYDKTERDRMRFLLQKASRIIDLIASGEVPLGTVAMVKLIDSLDEELGYEQEEQDEDDELQEVKDDRYSLINLYAAVKKEPGFLPLYAEIG